MPLVFVIDSALERSRQARYALEQGGYEVETFSTARELESATRELPDLFVIAVKLTDGSGMDLCRRLQGSPRLRGTRFILVAGSQEERYRAVVESGADDFIMSPFAPGELVSCVESVMPRLVPLEFSAASQRTADLTIDSSAMKVRVRGTRSSPPPSNFTSSTIWPGTAGKCSRGMLSWTRCGEICSLWHPEAWMRASGGSAERSSLIPSLRHTLRRFAASATSWTPMWSGRRRREICASVPVALWPAPDPADRRGAESQPRFRPILGARAGCLW